MFWAKCTKLNHFGSVWSWNQSQNLKYKSFIHFIQNLVDFDWVLVVTQWFWLVENCSKPAWSLIFHINNWTKAAWLPLSHPKTHWNLFCFHIFPQFTSRNESLMVQNSVIVFKINLRMWEYIWYSGYFQINLMFLVLLYLDLGLCDSIFPSKLYNGHRRLHILVLLHLQKGNFWCQHKVPLIILQTFIRPIFGNLGEYLYKLPC